MSEIDEAGTALFHQAMPFAKRLGIEVLRTGKDLVRSRLAWEDSLCTVSDSYVLHGGVLMSLADANGAALAFLNLPEGSKGTTTIESKTNFLRAVREGYATATSRPLQLGRRVMVIETEIHDDAGKLVAKVTQTQAVL